MTIYALGGSSSASDGANASNSFGEVNVSEPIPITQIYATYGLNQKVEEFSLGGGSVTVSDSMYQVATGTSPQALSGLLSRRQVTYRAGQGLLGRFTALFDTPQPNSSQSVGFVNNTDGLGFGYVNEEFGIVYNYLGESDIQELTITVPAGGNETADILVDGATYSVPLTAGTTDHNATEIAASLNLQVPAFDFTANMAEVVARSLLAVPHSPAFAFTSATAEGTWFEIQHGAIPVEGFVPQAQWNLDTCPGLDPSKGNVYQVRMQYAGFGGMTFYAEDDVTNAMKPVHNFNFANKNVLPAIGNPTFRIGWLVRNQGNTIPITVRGGSAAGFTEGPSTVTEASRAASSSNPAVATGEVTNMLSLRNRIVFGTRRNRVEAFGLSLTAATDSAKAAVVEVRVGATMAEPLVYDYIDKENSVIEVSRDPAIVSGGRLVSSFVIPAAGGGPIDLEVLSSLILPGEVLTFTAMITGGSASAVQLTVIWHEDL